MRSDAWVCLVVSVIVSVILWIVFDLLKWQAFGVFLSLALIFFGLGSIITAEAEEHR